MCERERERERERSHEEELNLLGFHDATREVEREERDKLEKEGRKEEGDDFFRGQK